jgi:hypothetical protein
MGEGVGGGEILQRQVQEWPEKAYFNKQLIDGCTLSVFFF